MGWSARRTDGDEAGRKNDRLTRRIILRGKGEDREVRSAEINRAGAVMLDPLAEIVIRVLVPIMIGLGQGVMDLQRRGKRRQHQQRQGDGQRDGGTRGS